jgi:hypothetical protein
MDVITLRYQPASCAMSDSMQGLEAACANLQAISPDEETLLVYLDDNSAVFKFAYSVANFSAYCYSNDFFDVFAKWKSNKCTTLAKLL